MSDTKTQVTLKEIGEARSSLEGLGEKYADLTKRAEKGLTDELRAERRTVADQLLLADDEFKIMQRRFEADQMAATLEAQESSGPKGGTRSGQGSDVEVRSVGQQVVESERYKSFQGTRSVTEMEVRTLLDSTGGVSGYTSGPGLFRPAGTAVLPPVNIQRTRLFMRDVLPAISTGLASVPYIRELNSAVNVSGAQFVAEGGAKPEVVMEFAQYDAAIRKIAAWIPMTYEILEDAPTLRGYVDSRLEYMLMLAEEAALLNGSGTAPSIRGLLQTTGLQTQTGQSDKAIALGLAIGKVENADGDATFVAVNPLDFWSMLTTRNSTTFDGGYGSVGVASPFGTPPSTVWGKSVVRSRSLAAGTALVGSAQGALILDRQATTIRVGDQHLDYFTTNKVAVLAEERLGFAVHRPDWFCKVTY